MNPNHLLIVRGAISIAATAGAVYLANKGQDGWVYFIALAAISIPVKT